MSKVKIEGNASGTGTLTISAPNTNTDRTLTLPDGAGEILLANGDGSSLTGISGGKVLQVVSTNYDTAYTGNNSGWADVSGFSASITPSSTSNKILVIVHAVMGSQEWCGLRVVESTDSDRVVGAGDSANLASRQDGGLFGANNISAYINGQATIERSAHILDSPASTSTVTYQIQEVGRYGTTAYSTYINRPDNWNNDSISGRITSSNITLMEIGA